MNLISDLDLYLIGEGRHERLWQVLGANPVDGGEGWRFAVWAPNAREVQVIGDFSGWWPDDGVTMHPQGGSGVWAATVPQAAAGQRYRYRVHGADGRWT